MDKIVIFAGTTEGRLLSECLTEAGVLHTVCVATDYGEIVLGDHPLACVHRGRMDQEQMEDFFRREAFAVAVDATHPYATVVTENIRAAAERTGTRYLRLKRELEAPESYAGIRYFSSHEDCVSALEQTEGNILLTTGSKELAVYAGREKLRERLYARVLPGIESLQICMEQGLTGKQILALQGPFTAQMNEAMISQYRIRCLVTKQSGRTGGFPEKVEAAKRQDIPVFVIGSRQQEEEGESFREVCHRLEELCGKKLPCTGQMEIVLAGVGMGDGQSLTVEVRHAIEQADILLGAERMIREYRPRGQKRTYYTAQKILPFLREVQEKEEMYREKKVVILFSGDSGFYSGCRKLHESLQKEIEEGGLRASLTILPGISSVSYLAACIGESYQDATICSMHGQQLHGLADRIRSQAKTFLITSGLEDVKRMGELLVDAGLEECRIYAGYQLSYREQTIYRLRPEECRSLTGEGLYTCCILNPGAQPHRLTHGMTDGQFIRGAVPMTKEEVREISICKLRLHRGAVVYDVGSGTGSIAVEIAALSGDTEVYAIERKEEAAELIELNRQKFGLDNICVVRALAPEGFEQLEAPSHAFIGGSGGRLSEILWALYRKNPTVRVVVNAVSMETICELKRLLAKLPVEEEEWVQVQVCRTQQRGGYQMMHAENPVWICAFSMREVKEDET